MILDGLSSVCLVNIIEQEGMTDSKVRDPYLGYLWYSQEADVGPNISSVTDHDSGITSC